MPNEVQFRNCWPQPLQWRFEGITPPILLMVLSLWDWPIWSPLLSYCGATPAFSVLASSALPAYLETEFMVGGLSLDTAQVLCSLVAALDAK